MHVLRKMVDAVKPGGLVFDLQVIRPDPTVESDGEVVCEIDGKHYTNGAELVDDFAGKQRRLPEHALAQLRTLTRPCVVRERCRLRRLQVR